MDAGLDTGDILLQETIPIDPDMTAGDLFARLAPRGAALLIRTIQNMEEKTLSATPQNAAFATFAPPLRKEEGLLGLEALPPRTTHNAIRGLQPWPGAYFLADGKRVKLIKSRVTADNKLELLTVQPEGKRPMPYADYLRGRRGAAANGKGEPPCT
jgi:methionyl-tRNA formyltransferase